MRHCVGCIIDEEQQSDYSNQLAKYLSVNTSQATLLPLDVLLDSSSLLFGHKHESSGQWVEGVLEQQLRQIGEKNTSSPHYLILHKLKHDDEDISKKLEPFNTLLDDNKRLTNSNGTFIDLPSNVRIIFVIDHTAT